MKRRPVSPLFAAQEPPTYVVDSSAWFNIRHLQNPEHAWTIMLALIELQRLVDPGQVIDEIKLDDDVWSRLHPVEARFRINRADEVFLLLAGRIASEHPRLAGIRSKKTKADPFVIALAELEHFTVVADESLKRPSIKIPGVCRERKLACVSLAQLLEAEDALLTT